MIPTTSITLSLTYDEIRCLQVAVQKINADMPGHTGLAALTPKIADIAYPAAVPPPVAAVDPKPATGS